jgi:integrase
MSNPNDDYEIISPEQNKLSLPQPTQDDVWDVALSGVISENSKRAYQHGMIEFARFILDRAQLEIPKDKMTILQKSTPLLPQVSFQLVTEYRDELRENGYANRTINLRLAAVNALYKKMMRLGLVKENPATAELVQRLRTSTRSDTDGLEQNEAEKILKLCHQDDSFRGKRDLAMFAVMIFNGVRRSELIQIDWDKIKYVNGIPTIKLKIKRDKDIVIEFIPQVWAAIDRWTVAANISKGPIFRRIRSGKGHAQKVTHDRLTVDGVYAIIKTRVKEAGIEKNIHPHSLRHTFATLSLLAGVPIQEVQKSMGHSSTDTTFRYDRAIEQVGRSPGRSIKLNWPGGPEKENSNDTD